MPGYDDLSAAAGISTVLWYCRRFEPGRHLPLVARAGFRAVELNLFMGPDHFDDRSRRAVRTLRRIAEGERLAVWSLHAPERGDLGSDDPAFRAEAITSLTHCLDVAHQLDAGVVVSHGLLAPSFADDGVPGAPVDERLADSLAHLASVAKAAGARIAFENPSVSVPGCTASDVLRRVRASDPAAFAFVLDTGHANLTGDLDAIAAGCGDRLVSLHLHDNWGARDDHLVPGRGTVDWDAVRALLTHVGYRGCAMYEDVAIPDAPHDDARLLAETMAAHERFFGNGGVSR